MSTDINEYILRQISNLIDIIEDIEEDPEAAQILSSYEGAPGLAFETTFNQANIPCTDACRTYELTWAIREATERTRKSKLEEIAARTAEKLEKVHI